MSCSLLGDRVSRYEIRNAFTVRTRRCYAGRQPIDNRIRWQRQKAKLHRDPAASLIFKARKSENKKRWYRKLKLDRNRYRRYLASIVIHRRKLSRAKEKGGTTRGIF